MDALDTVEEEVVVDVRPDEAPVGDPGAAEHASTGADWLIEVGGVCDVDVGALDTVEGDSFVEVGEQLVGVRSRSLTLTWVLWKAR